MASTLPQSFKNLPANHTEMSALKKPLEGDLEHKYFILRRRDEIQAQYSYAQKAAEVFAACLETTSAIKGAYAASILSTKALKNASKLYNNHEDILATISSTKGILATWAETVALAENLLAHLDNTTVQVERHLHLAADEQAAHESAHRAASGSLLYCTDGLRGVDQSIAEKQGTLFGLRLLPTEILPRIFMEAVDARQREIIISLSSYYDAGTSYYDLNALLTTLNLVPFALSATCKRWRAICQSTPGLWKYARVPTTTSPYPRRKVIGRAQFGQCALLAQKQPLELTVYPCYQAIHSTSTYSDLVLPPDKQGQSRLV